MIAAKAFAHAAATVAGAAYVVCRLLASIAPNFLFAVGQSWFHTVDLSAIRGTGGMTFGTFILGLVSSVAATWVGAYMLAVLYNRWVKA